jgi:outer membrane protein
VVGPTPGAPTLGLSAAVGRALQSNFGLLGAADAVRRAQIGTSVARAQFLPKLTPSLQGSSTALDSYLGVEASQRLPWSGGSLAAGAELRRLSDSALPLARSSFYRLELTQPLLRGFGPNATFFDLTTRRRLEQGQQRAFELGRQQLAVQVTGAFYAVLQQRALLAVARQSLRRSQSLERASEARLRVGLVSKLDVFRAQLQSAQAEESVVRAQASLETALESFRVLLGLSPTDPIEPEAAELPEILEDPDPEPIESLVSRALQSRLDVQETRDQVSDARRSASLARQNLLPQLDLKLGVTQFGQGPTYGLAWRAGDRAWNLSFTTSYPLERARDVAARAEADLDVTARGRTLRERELGIESEVRAAVREMAQIRKSVELQRQATDVARQQHRLATLRYQRGLASNFDVVEAEGSLVQAKSALVGLLARYQVARVELLRVTGRLDLSREYGP